MAPLAGPGGAGDFAVPGPPGALVVGMRKANDNEEAILVTVRVRPLSSQELAERDVAVWRCTDEKTLTFMDHVPERSPYPSAYAFDRVFGPVASSEQVYAEAARDLVQSSLSGLNATVFAYGQTSSGKTHTMRAVSRSAVQDIFEHIQRTPQREYLIRVSALEIYNEVVRDLLRPDSGPLRLLDDPERGTVVERLAEEVVRSSGHLYQILEDCEAQRQVGETMLNDNSSRSHQIIRLSVESCPSMEEGMVAGAGGSHVLMSVLNFVDLAGSERASQTLAEGARLKEGGHINRSLLTLGTVIRKLGESNKLRRGHIPYRDSKLTRILQHSLGGNARTAIICTMSPARAHVEQTRNTLSFATRAKEVTNSAHVNLVVSDKVLIKRLQREVARLEAELAVAANPRELQARDIRIQQIEMQLHELVRQRDAAQAHARELTKAMIKGDRGDETSQKATKSWSPDTVKKLLRRSGKKKKTRLGAPDDVSIESAPLFGTSASRFLEYKEMRERRRERQREREREREAEAAVLDGEKRKLETMHERLGQGADVAMQALHKEIECLRLAQAQAVVGGAKSADIAGMIDKLQAELEGLQAAQAASVPEEDAGAEAAPEGEAPPGMRKAAVNASMERMIQLLRDELARLQSATKADEKADQEISALEEKLESAQLSLDKFYDSATPGDDPLLSSGRRVLAPRSPGGANAAGPPASPRLHRRSPSAGGALPGGHQENDENAPGGQDSGHYSAPEDGEKTPRRGGASSVDIRRMQSLFKTAAEENVRSIKNYVTELKERIAKLHYQKQLLVCQVLELEGAARRSGEESEGPAGLRPEVWVARCEEQTAAIVQLWDMCNVSLFHRTQFYLLFSSAAAADHVYLEVEQRRLEWLREQCLLTLEDGHDEPRAIRGSLKRLRHERDVLARRMRDRLSDMERGLLFEQWGVPLTSKARKQQLAALVWNNPFDAKHVRDSADLVARLMDFGDASTLVPKEMFGLKFAQPGRKRNWLMRIASTG